MPGGQMPVLEVDGVKLGQSMTIARYLANKFNLAGSTPLEKAQADMIVDCVSDFFAGEFERYMIIKIVDWKNTAILSIIKFFNIFLNFLEMVKQYFEKDENKKKELEEKMKNEVAPAFIKNMTTILTTNGGQWLVGKGVSYISFQFDKTEFIS